MMWCVWCDICHTHNEGPQHSSALHRKIKAIHYVCDASGTAEHRTNAPILPPNSILVNIKWHGVGWIMHCLVTVCRQSVIVPTVHWNCEPVFIAFHTFLHLIVMFESCQCGVAGFLKWSSTIEEEKVEFSYCPLSLPHHMLADHNWQLKQ